MTGLIAIAGIQTPGLLRGRGGVGRRAEAARLPTRSLSFCPAG